MSTKRSNKMATVGVSARVLEELLGAVRAKFGNTIVASKDVVESIVKPLSKSEKTGRPVSFAERMVEKYARKKSKYVAKANLFVSHAWNANVVHLLDTLIDSAKSRKKNYLFLAGYLLQ
eukprot:m.39858 g.39858  ORF g.39858 m.39858 type:complete len:119 (-) comp14760_c0_seq1:541-897(-)